MLNLLPQEQKRELQKEYAARRAVVWLSAISAVLAISLIILSPAFLLTKIRTSEVTTDLNNVKKALDAQMPSTEIVSQLRGAVRNASALVPLVEPRSAYDMMTIFEAKPREIKISSLAFSAQSSESGTIAVGGTAADRESLTAFSRALEARAEFTRVDLPVSNFVKEKNIPFTMTVTLK